MPLLVAGCGGPGRSGTPGPQADATCERLIPPPSGLYHAAFPDFSQGDRNEDYVTTGRLTGFEKAAGKPVAWAVMTQHWYRGITFPAREVATVTAAGAVPYIRLFPWSSDQENRPEARFTLARIAAGDFDADLRRWADAARASRVPLLLEFGTEVNGSWFPWNGAWNGAGAPSSVPGVYLGAERFRAAYRHIVELFRRERADNVTWFFHVDAAGTPDVPWNAIEQYYPGDDVVDWVGFSAYGAQHPGDDWESFDQVVADQHVYDRLAALTSKPIAVLETGVAQLPGHDKAAWIREAYGSLASGRYPRIKAVAWWDESYQDQGDTVDLRIDSSPSAQAAYRAAVSSATYVGTARFAGSCS